MTQITKSILILLLLLFYGSIFIFYGFAFGSTSDINTSSDSIGRFSFDNIITGIINVPIWINAIVFTPLVITLIFVIVTSLPTFNGGS